MTRTVIVFRFFRMRPTHGKGQVLLSTIPFAVATSTHSTHGFFRSLGYAGEHGLVMGHA
jgi:hypothetical protein